MATRTASPPPTTPTFATVADLLERLGNVPGSRVRMQPTPGSATEEDLVRLLDREKVLCELIDGVLVEKAVGYKESMIAVLIGMHLLDFVRPRRLGIVLGADGPVRVLPAQVRMPDVAFVARGRFPGGRLPDEAILDMAPDLAVEVLSRGNTRAEMARKLREYFEAGTRLVWMVDPRSRTVRVHTGPGPRQSTLLGASDTLDGGEVLPGFAVVVRELFPAAEE